jgi:hypothetical protein
MAHTGPRRLASDGGEISRASTHTAIFTDHPTVAGRDSKSEKAFPDDRAPRYLLRDRDGVYGSDFGDMLTRCGIEDIVTAPRSPGPALSPSDHSL